MSTFYNEIDAYCCRWLANLGEAGVHSIIFGNGKHQPIARKP